MAIRTTFTFIQPLKKQVTYYFGYQKFISIKCNWKGEAVSTSAVTITVGDRTSHGILNLDRLAIKASTEAGAADAVVLSSGGRFWTTYICSGTTLSNGTCKKVSDLLTSQYTGTFTIKWSGNTAAVFNQSSDAFVNIIPGSNVTIEANNSNHTIKISSNGGPGTVRVENTNNTLNWNESVVIATVNWSGITAKLPAQPSWWDWWYWSETTGKSILTSPTSQVRKMLKPTYNFFKSEFFEFIPTENHKSSVKIGWSWLTIGEVANVWAVAGSLHVAWPIILWNIYGNNYFYMDFTWNAGTDAATYSMKAAKELEIGIDNWAYMYFKSFETNVSSDTPFRIWVNTQDPKATLDVKWSIRINSQGTNVCMTTSCSVSNVWTIFFRNNKFYWCVKKSSNNYWRQEFTMNAPSEDMWMTLDCAEFQGYAQSNLVSGDR